LPNIFHFPKYDGFTSSNLQFTFTNLQFTSYMTGL